MKPLSHWPGWRVFMPSTWLGLTFAGLLAAAAVLPAQALPLVDSHGRNGVGCAQCHGDTQPPVKPAQATCLKCHESGAELVEATRRYQPNPHQVHLGDLKCSHCHAVHVEKKADCKSCHPARSMQKK